MGNLSPEPISVGQLFAGALIPGLVLVGLYMTWILIKSIIDPKSCPPLEMTPESRAGLAGRVVTSLAPPLLLIVAVLGSILLGVATATESASVGALGAIVLAAGKRQFNMEILQSVMRSTLRISSMVFVILLGASVFSLVFRGLGGENLVFEALADMPGGAVGATFVVMAVIFALGFFLDTFEIIFIVVPIAAPILIQLGVDPLWLGVAIGMNLQTSYLTPPFGFALFYLRGVAPPSVTTGTIYKGAFPFVILQVLGLVVISFFPSMVTALPKAMFSTEVVAAPLPGPTNSGAATPPSGTGDDFSDLYGPRNENNKPVNDDFGRLYPN
jgi:tripartite ATP-independent transporter DctM subunit